MGIVVNNDSKPIGVHNHTVDVTKANPYRDGATGRFSTGGGGGGGSVAPTPATSGGISSSSERDAREKTYNSEKKKMNESLDRAQKLGALDADIQDVKLRHQAEDVSGLEDLETGFLESHADFSRGGNGGMSGFGQTVQTLEQLHTATVHALRSLTGTGKETWPTMTEMGGT